MTNTITRELSEEEKKKVKKLAGKNSFDGFKAKVALAVQEHQHRYEPYCLQCALTDYKIEAQRIRTEIELQGGAISDEKIYDQIKLDVQKYSGHKLFDKIDESEAREHILIGTSKVNKKIGIHRNYQCKRRNHGLAIFLPNKRLREEAEEKPKVEKKDAKDQTKSSTSSTAPQPPVQR